eukprot:scaffold131301_cov32-Tisochrysis_lutea.AAC.3
MASGKSSIATRCTPYNSGAITRSYSCCIFTSRAKGLGQDPDAIPALARAPHASNAAQALERLVESAGTPPMKSGGVAT